MLALSAFALVLTTNPPSILLSIAGLTITLAYPYAKRLTAMPQAVLGVAFSFGIPMAYAAIQGRLPWECWVLLAANVCYAFAYDTEYAMVDRDDDVRIGIRTSAITFGRHDVAFVMACYALHLLSWAWLGRLLGLLRSAGCAAGGGGEPGAGT